MSDLSSNPLLASVGHISKSASIALAVIDGILAIAMIAKLVVIKENRFAYIMLTVLVSSKSSQIFNLTTVLMRLSIFMV